MPTIANLAVSLTAKIGSFEKGFKKAQGIAGRFATDMTRHVKTIAGYGAAITGVAAGALTIMTKKQFAAIDAQAKLAQSLQTSTQSIINLERAGELAGVAMSGIEQATKDLTRRLSQAAGGTGPAVDALDRLELSAEGLISLPLDERIRTINAAIREFIPEAERAAVAGQLFGEEGSIAMSRLSPDVIAQATREVKAMGKELSDVDAKMIESANDSMSQIGGTITAVAQKLAVQLAPFIKVVADRFTVFAQSVTVNGGVVSSAVDRISSAVVRLVNLIELVKAAWQLFVGVVSKSAAILIAPARALVKAWNKALDFLGMETSGNLEKFLDDLTKGFEDQAAGAISKAGEALEKFNSGFTGKQAQAYFEGIKAQAAKFKDEVDAGLKVPGVDGGAGAGSLAERTKTGSFSQIDTSRIAVNAMNNSGNTSEKQMVQQQKQTNGYLSVLVRRDGAIIV